jgi:hypothetical protein
VLVLSLLAIPGVSIAFGDCDVPVLLCSGVLGVCDGCGALVKVASTWSVEQRAAVCFLCNLLVFLHCIIRHLSRCFGYSMALQSFVCACGGVQTRLAKPG